MPRWLWLAGRLTRRLWVRASAIGALGILAALLAMIVDRCLPWRIPGSISASAVNNVLTIIASSMLAVTTFSLNIMVSAFGSATSNVTPRSTRLLVEDRLTQNALSTFIGAFLFSIVGLVVLATRAYGDRGRDVLFVITIAIIGAVVISLLRWIDHLTRLGRVTDSNQRIEKVTRAALQERLENPYLGGTRLGADAAAIPPGAIAIIHDGVGYVQNIDIAALAGLCDDSGSEVFVAALPGRFVYPNLPLAWLTPPRKETDLDALRAAMARLFIVGGERTFEQDPRFGLCVLCEVACRALSPAVNDPGTAIDIIGRATRLMTLWAKVEDEAREIEPRYAAVHVPPLKVADLFDDAFRGIARDGAAVIEVQLRLQKSLLALSQMSNAAFRAAAAGHARLAGECAQEALAHEDDRARLRELIAAGPQAYGLLPPAR